MYRIGRRLAARHGRERRDAYAYDNAFADDNSRADTSACASAGAHVDADHQNPAGDTDCRG